MLEAARILGWLAAALLVAAVAAWVPLLSGPALRRLDGGTEPDVARTELASRALIFAFGLSALAAALAIAGWFAH
jgi:hypothetical protein